MIGGRARGNVGDDMPPNDREALLRAAFDATPIPQLVVDRGARLTLANRAAEGMLGVGEHDVGRPVADLTLGPQTETVAAAVERALATASRQSAGQGERSGSVAVIATPLASSAGDVYAVCISFTDDIEARTVFAHDEFLANAAHELLTPLTGIVGAAHALESGASDDPQVRDRFLRHIAVECNRLARIGRALLALARARSGEQAPQREDVHLRTLLQNVVAASPDPSTIRVDCPDDADVFVDADLVEQALSNLVANSLRHAPIGEVRVTVEKGPSTIAIDVVDSGGGIDPADVERLRQRFATADGRGSRGYGLGLSIAIDSIEATGGALTFAAHGTSGMHPRVVLPSARR